MPRFFAIAGPSSPNPGRAHAVASTITDADRQPDQRSAIRPGEPLARRVTATRTVSADALERLWETASSDGSAPHLLLIPYDAATTFEPAIARTPGLIARAAGPIVCQRLGKGVPVRPNASGNDTTADGSRFRVGEVESAWSRPGFMLAVERVLGLIRAGDVYQVNIGHRLRASFKGDASALARVLLGSASPEFGGFMCYDDPARPSTRHAVVSLSPELFLAFEPDTRAVRTKPMKGTRPITGDPDELLDAEKDRAELNMIVDLMRNDLGRVAEPGTVRVTEPRSVDAHAGSVWQATATVEARLGRDRTPADLITACFPPGSITGAPKVRAAQIIRELEPHARGPYCGTLIGIDPGGRMTASVLIRTAHITGTPDPADPHGFLDAELHFHVGAGIVADSDPAAEWEETITKAGVLLDAIAQPLRV
ncbi:MAG: anthranilate synthase component I family protein [Planctomycetota bacterium]